MKCEKVILNNYEEYYTCFRFAVKALCSNLTTKIALFIAAMVLLYYKVILLYYKVII